MSIDLLTLANAHKEIENSEIKAHAHTRELSGEERERERVEVKCRVENL